MKVAIVGSRKRSDKQNVYDVVDSLDKKDVVVSGGCVGVDTWAEDRANERGLKTEIYKPRFNAAKGYHEIVKVYYARNKQIAEAADIVFAFVWKSRTGGTENTIEYARKLGKKVVIK